MAWFMGIDIGSRTTKGVIIDGGDIKASQVIFSEADYLKAAIKLRESLLARAGLKAGDIANTVITGQDVGKKTVKYSDDKETVNMVEGGLPFEGYHVVDIRCCARGINHIFPAVRTIIDVEQQSAQVIQISEKGQVINFAVSERCASGSGRFLEIIANILQIKLEEIGPLSLKAKNPAGFTTGCAVFGESEAVSRVAEGISREDILAGVHKALADKMSTLVGRIGLKEQYAISGGGGLDVGLIKALEEKLKVKLNVPPQPQLVTALGAAVIAKDELGTGPKQPQPSGYTKWDDDKDI